MQLSIWFNNKPHKAETSVKNHSYTTAQEIAAFHEKVHYHADNSLPMVTHPFNTYKLFYCFLQGHRLLLPATTPPNVWAVR